MNAWKRFGYLLSEENRLLGELGQKALILTDALVANVPEQIESAERHLEAARLLHATAYNARMSMQKSGFGGLTLQQVCAYAPPALRREFYNLSHQITVRGIALRMTVSNNKALILAGLERLARTVAIMQRASTEQTGTYKRRGIIPPPEGSVLVSRRA